MQKARGEQLADHHAAERPTEAHELGLLEAEQAQHLQREVGRIMRQQQADGVEIEPGRVQDAELGQDFGQPMSIDAIAVADDQRARLVQPAGWPRRRSPRNQVRPQMKFRRLQRLVVVIEARPGVDSHVARNVKSDRL